MRKIIISLAVMVLAAAAAANSEELVLQPGPEDGVDAWVWSAMPGYNAGAEQGVLTMIWPSGPGQAYGLMKFDFPSDVSNATLQNATLGLYSFFIYSNPDIAPNNELYAYKITSTWDEATVTWDSIPSYDGANSFSSSALSPAQGWVYMDITPICAEWLSGSTQNNGLLLGNIISDGAAGVEKDFYSSDYGVASLRPKLILEYSPAPEPVSSALFIIGGGALALSRRRKTVSGGLK